MLLLGRVLLSVVDVDRVTLAYLRRSSDASFYNEATSYNYRNSTISSRKRSAYYSSVSSSRSSLSSLPPRALLSLGSLPAESSGLALLAAAKAVAVAFKVRYYYVVRASIVKAGGALISVIVKVRVL